MRSPAGEISTTSGTTTVGGRVPVSLADHVRIGSITKTWTGTMILQQAQEGKLTDPQKKVTIVVWVNLDPTAVHRLRQLPVSALISR
jgi:Beta-lactamase